MSGWALVLEVEGVPVPKGRARTVTTSRGKTRTYTPERTVAAEEEIAWRAKATRVRFDHAVDVELDVVFCVKRYRGDPDNLLKLVADALEKGGVYENDRQVTKTTAEIIVSTDDREFTLIRARAR